MSLYTVSPGTLPLASDVQQLVDVFNGKHDIGAITFAPSIAIPTLGAASASASAGAGLSVGVYKYVFTYKTGYKKTNGSMVYAGETTQTAFITATTTAPNSHITLSSLPTAWPTSAVGLALYRTTVGGSTYALVTVLTTPTASYIDSLADASLTTAVPVTNTTGVTIPYVDAVNTALVNHEADYTEHVPYGGATTGSANTYVLAAPTITALSVGMAVSVKFNVDSTGASTLNWNGKGAKGIKKANGTDVTNLKATGIYTLRYDGANFILQGEGGSGNATASGLLSGLTASTDAGDIVGTIPVVAGGNTITPSTATQTAIASTTYATSAISVAGDANLIGANIPISKAIFGVTGTYSTIKSRQSGSVLLTSSVAVTISAVDLTKAIVRISFSGVSFNNNTAQSVCPTAKLTNATTITLAIGDATNTITATWEVIEFNGLKSLQSGTWTATSTSQTLAISSINTSKSMLYFSDDSNSVSTAAVGAPSSLLRIEITSSVLLTAKQGNSDTRNIMWYLVEFN